MRMKKRILINCIQALSALLFMLLAWGIAYLSFGNELLVPSLFDCAEEFGKLLVSGSFWLAVANTLLRTLGAFAVSLVLAGIMAVISYMLPSFGRFFMPIVSALRSLPTLAVLLILLVWWGVGFAPVAVAFLSLFPMLYAGISAALSQVDNELVEMSRAYKVPLKKQITQLYIPSALPYVLRESGAAVSFSLKLVVSAEVIANTAKSLGGLLQEAKNYSEIPMLFALVGVAFIIGFIFELVCVGIANAVERRVK